MKMTHCCEECRRVTELYHVRATDQYLCEDCIELLIGRLEPDDEQEKIVEGPQLLIDLLGKF